MLIIFHQSTSFVIDAANIRAIYLDLQIFYCFFYDFIILNFFPLQKPS